MFELKMNTDNDAFFTNPTELADILRIVAQHVDNGVISGGVLDSNGNTIGRFFQTYGD
jgi:hypothetical protein